MKFDNNPGRSKSEYHHRSQKRGPPVSGTPPWSKGSRRGESGNPNLIPLGSLPPTSSSSASSLLSSSNKEPSSPSASSVASFASCHSELQEEANTSALASPPPSMPKEAKEEEEERECSQGNILVGREPEMKIESRQELEEIYGSVALDVEEPCKVNGENYQIRLRVYEQVFIGRSLSLRDATDRCCLKAVRYIKQHHLGPFQETGSLDRAGDKKRKRRSKKEPAPRGKGYHDLESDKKSVGSDGEKKMDFRNIPIKNAIMMLNEMFPPPKAPQYKVLSQTGPPNNPTFTMMCTIESNSYVGEGKSKKEAKLVSSQKAIEVLCGYKQTETRSVPERSNPRANCDLDDWMELEGKNPVSILNELYPGIQYQLLSTTGPSHAPNFIIKAILNNMSFEGSGKSKKDAKLNASKALLVHLHKVGFDPMTGDMMSTRDNNDAAAIGHTFADRISQLVHYKYQELFGTTTYSKRRVMAAIVMTQDNADGGESDSGSGDEEVTNCPTVIAVSSGTKCINGEQISLEGCVVNDSHAEIVARRCLLLFLYTHLEKFSQQESDDSIFQRPEDEGRCVLKEGIQFHLFITTSPCGDARIFSLHETNGSSKKEDKVQVDSASESGGKNLDENNNQIVNWEVSDETKSEPRWTNDNSTAVPSMDENEIIKQDGENMAKNCHITLTDGHDMSEIVHDNVKMRSQSPIVDENNNVIGEVDENNNVIGEVDENNNPRTTSDESSLLPLDATDSLSDQEEGQKEEQMLLIVPERAESMKTSSSSTSLNEGGTSGIEKKSNDSSRGMLRSKIECGMGTVPISPKIQIQTWDGVMSGDRLLTMACSDKLLRWNVLGVQGACLTHLIDPIYFSTITVGSKFHPGHMRRALYNRIQPYISDLPGGYKMNNADLLATTSPETRQATKAHDYSVNWIIDHGQPEIVNGSTGKTISDNVSRLSKKMLFKKFLNLNGRLLKDPFSSPCRYSEVKMKASDYQEAKSAFNAALKEAGCGVWIDKPIEQDQFSL